MKQLRRILPLMISVILFYLIVVPAVAESEEQGCCTALIEAQTGMCLGGDEPKRVVPVGSQTKLMTVYLTAEAIAAGRLGMDEQVTVAPSAEGAPGATVWLEAGEQMTAGDLLKAVIIGNANDACIALACRISGTEQQFVMEMNAAAFSLGMRHTRFADCTGLSAENQSTAHELGLLCRALLPYDFLHGSWTAWREFLRGDATELVNENRLTKGYAGLCGFKAGHGDASGYTLTLAASREGLCMIAVVLGDPDADARFDTAKTMLHDAFRDYYVTTPAYSAEYMKPVKVRRGTADAVILETGELLSVALPKGEGISSVTVLPRWIEAPVQKHAAVGAVAFYSGDTLICEVPLCTAEAIPRRRFADTLRMLLAALFR